MRDLTPTLITFLLSFAHELTKDIHSLIFSTQQHENNFNNIGCRFSIFAKKMIVPSVIKEKIKGSRTEASSNGQLFC